VFEALLSQFCELGFCLGQFRLVLAEPILMLGWSAMVGAPAFHGVLALHDFSGEALNLFEKILLRTVHGCHHNMDASL